MVTTKATAYAKAAVTFVAGYIGGVLLHVRTTTPTWEQLFAPSAVVSGLISALVLLERYTSTTWASAHSDGSVSPDSTFLSTLITGIQNAVGSQVGAFASAATRSAQLAVSQGLAQWQQASTPTPPIAPVSGLQNATQVLQDSASDTADALDDVAHSADKVSDAVDAATGKLEALGIAQEVKPESASPEDKEVTVLPTPSSEGIQEDAGQ